MTKKRKKSCGSRSSRQPTTLRTASASLRKLGGCRNLDAPVCKSHVAATSSPRMKFAQIRTSHSRPQRALLPRAVAYAQPPAIQPGLRNSDIFYVMNLLDSSPARKLRCNSSRRRGQQKPPTRECKMHASASLGQCVGDGVRTCAQCSNATNMQRQKSRLDGMQNVADQLCTLPAWELSVVTSCQSAQSHRTRLPFSSAVPLQSACRAGWRRSPRPRPCSRRGAPAAAHRTTQRRGENE
eukprot:6198481-Pleurochrysis_carterae.AAC.1